MEPNPNLTNDKVLRVYGPMLVSILIIGLFGYGYFRNPFDAGMNEIVKNLTILVAGFWIGSSSSSKNNAVVPGVTAPPAVPPPVVPPEPSPTVVVQTGSPANAEAAQAPPAPERTPSRQPRPSGSLIQGLPRS